MAQQRKRYSFADVGQNIDDFKETNRTYKNLQPINIKTPITLDLSKKNTFVMHYDFVKATKDNLRNLINTNYGERLMFPNFGANIQELAWEVGTESGDHRIMARIKKTVSEFMPYISLDGYEPIAKQPGQERTGIRVFFIISGFSQDVHGIEINLNVSG